MCECANIRTQAFRKRQTLSASHTTLHAHPHAAQAYRAHSTIFICNSGKAAYTLFSRTTFFSRCQTCSTTPSSDLYGT